MIDTNEKHCFVIYAKKNIFADIVQASYLQFDFEGQQLCNCVMYYTNNKKKTDYFSFVCTNYSVQNIFFKINKKLLNRKMIG